MLMGLGLFASIALLMSQRDSFSPFLDKSFDRIIQVVVIVASIAFLVIGFNFFRKKLMEVRSSTLAAEKRMEQYLSACIIWWTMIEIPGIIAVIGFLLTHNHALLFLGIFHLLLLFIFMPRKENIILLLNLNSEEVKRLEGKG